MADEIRIELVADANGVIRAVEKVVPAAEKAGKKAAEAIEKPINKTSENIKSSFLAVGAVISAAMGGAKFVEAAAVQDAAVQKLNASLRNMGVFTEETSRTLQDFASALQSQSTVGDEVVLNQLAIAQAMGATVNQSKKILTVAADMSSALGMSLDSATRNLSKSLGGALGELGELAPELKGLTQEQLKNGAAIDILAKKYAGFATAETKTFTGAMKQLQNTLGDAAEKIGEAIVKSPVLIKAINLISQAINNTFGKFPVEALIKDLNGFIITIAEVAESLTFLIQPIVNIGRIFDLMFSGAKTGFQSLIVFFTQSLNTLVQNLPSVFQKILPVEEIQQAAESASSVMDSFIAETNGKFDTLLEHDTSLAESIKQNVTEFASALNEIDQNTLASTNNLGAGLDKTSQKVVSFKEKADEAFKTVNQMIRNTMTKTISQGIQSMMSSLMTGENGMADFGKFVLGMFGQLAIQMGEFFIAQGIAQMALISNPFTAPAAMIAAGAGLIALGAIISSLGGSSGRAPSTSSGGVSAGGAPAGGIMDTGGPLDEVIAGEEGPAAIEKQQQVQLVVQGDVLDSESTGTRLLEILNSEFDSKGGRIAYA